MYRIIKGRITRQLGNMPVNIVSLNINVRDGAITFAESFKMREDMPSIPARRF